MELLERKKCKCYSSWKMFSVVLIDPKLTKLTFERASRVAVGLVVPAMMRLCNGRVGGRISDMVASAMWLHG